MFQLKKTIFAQTLNPWNRQASPSFLRSDHNLPSRTNLILHERHRWRPNRTAKKTPSSPPPPPPPPSRTWLRSSSRGFTPPATPSSNSSLPSKPYSRTLCPRSTSPSRSSAPSTNALSPPSPLSPTLIPFPGNPRTRIARRPPTMPRSPDPRIRRGRQS